MKRTKEIAIILIVLFLGTYVIWATVSTQTTKVSFACNGSTTTFSATGGNKIPCFAATDIKVYIRTDSTGAQSLLTLTSDYSVTAFNNDFTNGFTVTTIATYASGKTLVVKRSIALTQEVNLIRGRAIPAEPMERTFDRQILALQDKVEVLGRALRIPVTDSSYNMNLPSSVDRKGKYLGFSSATGDPIVTEGTADSVVHSSFMETVADDADAAAVRTTLLLTDYTATLGLADLITKGPWFDVRAYGAIVNDNSINNVTAINLAVTACLATDTGGIVYFPPGAWWVDDGSITVTNGGNRSIWFVGAGMYASRIVKTLTGTGDVIIWNCTTNPSGIQNLGIVAAVGGNFGVDGISATVMNGVFFENIWMGGFQNGFNLIGTDIHLSNCISEQNNGYGFVFDMEIRAVNCKSYLNGSGFLLRYSAAPAYPDEPCVLIGCNDGESKNAAVDISSRDNVEIIGFTISSSGRNLNVGIKITGSNQIKILGGNLRYCDDYGIQFVGACSEIVINGITIQEIGQTTTGVGIQIVSSCSNILVSNSILKEIRLSAIKTANSSGTRITNNSIRTFGRNETAGDKFGVLLDGDASHKGATVSQNQFILTGGDTQTGISFESGAQGKFFIRANEYQNGTLMDLTNAPVGTIVENNQDDYALNTLANDATPSVKGRKLWKTGGTTTITDFDDGYEGHIFILVSEHSLIITDGTNIFLSGSSNWAMTATDTLTLIQKSDGKWYEISRSDSGA